MTTVMDIKRKHDTAAPDALMMALAPAMEANAKKRRQREADRQKKGAASLKHCIAKQQARLRYGLCF